MGTWVHISSTHVKNPGVVALTCTQCRAEGRETDAGWLASLLEKLQALGFSERPCLEGIKADSDRAEYPTFSSGLCTHVRAARTHTSLNNPTAEIYSFKI